MPTTDADDPSFIRLLIAASVPSSYVANEAFLWEPRKTVVVLIAVKTMRRADINSFALSQESEMQCMLF